MAIKKIQKRYPSFLKEEPVMSLTLALHHFFDISTVSGNLWHRILFNFWPLLLQPRAGTKKKEKLSIDCGGWQEFPNKKKDRISVVAVETAVVAAANCIVDVARTINFDKWSRLPCHTSYLSALSLSRYDLSTHTPPSTFYLLPIFCYNFFAPNPRPFGIIPMTVARVLGHKHPD